MWAQALPTPGPPLVSQHPLYLDLWGDAEPGRSGGRHIPPFLPLAVCTGCALPLLHPPHTCPWSPTPVVLPVSLLSSSNTEGIGPCHVLSAQTMDAGERNQTIPSYPGG